MANIKKSIRVTETELCAILGKWFGENIPSHADIDYEKNLDVEDELTISWSEDLRKQPPEVVLSLGPPHIVDA